MSGDFDRTVTKSENDQQQPKQHVNQTLVLVGMMGCGKTTVGRRLAARLGLDFIDTDAEIEKAAGLSVSDIFELYGEDEFRDGERRVIQRLLDGSPKVLATGGGAFINDETRALILDQAIAIWLRADLDTLVERTARRNTRPLLRKGNPKQILAKLLNERQPKYQQAQIHIRTGAGPHETVVKSIVTALEAQKS
jgi:shikimate kinase